ncbi:MAG: hypothetical protein DRQ88_08385 [Epsilonproteobacteria bacterium]|nr:MAG: hypothetical protein DRQ89_10900 [Campylobacterota bacterium]RLA65946.1 MAG: hypothetical protein DRQ88_08385 [Campylobacterota bacterium]
MRTIVVINENIQNQLDKDIKSSLFDEEVRYLVAFWKMEIEEIGFDDYLISDLAQSLDDHRLSKDRQGERSITLNPKGGRLIYKYYKGKIMVKVIKISPDHNYS